MAPDILRNLRPRKSESWESDSTGRFQMRLYKGGQATAWVRDTKDVYWDLLFPPQTPPRVHGPSIVVLRMRDRDIVADGQAGTVRFVWRNPTVANVMLRLSWLGTLELDSGRHGEARFEVRIAPAQASRCGANDELAFVMSIAEEHVTVADVMRRHLLRLWQGYSESSIRSFAVVDDRKDLPEPDTVGSDSGSGDYRSEGHFHQTESVSPASSTRPDYSGAAAGSGLIPGSELTSPSASVFAVAAQTAPPLQAPPPRSMQRGSTSLLVNVHLAPAGDDWIGFALLPDTEQLLDAGSQLEPQPAIADHYSQTAEDFDRWRR